MRLKLFNFIHCLFKWISVKLPIRPVSGLRWIMINPNKSFDLRTLVNMFQLCGDRKEEYPYFDLDCILCFLVFSTIWTRKVSISVNCSWNMYRFLQVISFLSFIFKKVLYIRMTINFTVQWVAPTLFRFAFFAGHLIIYWRLSLQTFEYCTVSSEKKQ